MGKKKGNIKVVNLTRINNQAIKLNNYHLIIPIWPKKFIYQKQNPWIKTYKKSSYWCIKTLDYSLMMLCECEDAKKWNKTGKKNS
jgi:hypothetical protein